MSLRHSISPFTCLRCSDFPYPLHRGNSISRFSCGSLIDISPSTDLAISLPECLGRDLQLASSLSVDVNAVAKSVRVPLNCLEGIWSKAAEFIKTDKAIVSAPGVGPNAKFVKSYSGQRPHLVALKRGKVFTCDQECHNWRSLSICAHTVSVAELCGQLPEFIACSKRVPSLTEFAEAMMPKGKGRKGTQCPRKRKPSVPTTTVIENPSLSACPSESEVDQPASDGVRHSPLATSLSQVSNIDLPSVTQNQHLANPSGTPAASLSQITNFHIPSLTQTQQMTPPLYSQQPWSYSYFPAASLPLAAITEFENGMKCETTQHMQNNYGHETCILHVESSNSPSAKKPRREHPPMQSTVGSVNESILPSIAW